MGEFALRALGREWARKGLNSWIDFTNARRRNGDLLVRALGALQYGAVHAAFNTWFAHLYPDKVRLMLGVDEEEEEEEDEEAAAEWARRSSVFAAFGSNEKEVGESFKKVAGVEAGSPDVASVDLGALRSNAPAAPASDE